MYKEKEEKKKVKGIQWIRKSILSLISFGKE